MRKVTAVAIIANVIAVYIATAFMVLMFVLAEGRSHALELAPAWTVQAFNSSVLSVVATTAVVFAGRRSLVCSTCHQSTLKGTTVPRLWQFVPGAGAIVRAFALLRTDDCQSCGATR